MVNFDQLRISDDGLSMYISAHVLNIPDCENLYIDSLTIKTASQVSETAPELFEGDYIYHKENLRENSGKSFEMKLSINDPALIYDKPNFSEDLFFVYVKTTGTPGACIPCRLDECTTIGVTFDETLLYQKVMHFTKQLNTGCNTPNKEFIDFILLWNAFKASVETEHYNTAKNFYKMLFEQLEPVQNKNCNCHG